MMPGISLPINSCTTSLSAPLREAARRPALLCSSMRCSGGQVLQYNTSCFYFSNTSSSVPTTLVTCVFGPML
jgi:hypothetical protein